MRKITTQRQHDHHSTLHSTLHPFELALISKTQDGRGGARNDGR